MLSSRRTTVVRGGLLTLLSAVALAACSSDASSPSSVSPSPTSSAATSSTPATSVPPRTVTTTVRPSTTTLAPPPARVPRGTVVVLNPGHNGGNESHPDEINRLVPAGYGDRKPCDTTGTSTNAGYPEHAFNWDVALRLRRALEAAGVTVRMTRSNDDSVGPCVDERADDGNRSDVAAVVTIHADGAPSSGHGFHVNQASKRPDGATKAVASASRRLGKDIGRTLASSSGLTPSTYIGTDGYYLRSDFAALNLATRPATFLELGNMRNAGDADLLSSRSGRAKIASAIAAGLIDFLRSR